MPNAAGVQHLHGPLPLQPEQMDARQKRIIAACQESKKAPGIHPDADVDEDFSAWRLPSGETVWVSALVSANKDGKLTATGVKSLPPAVMAACRSGCTAVGVHNVPVPTCIINAVQSKLDKAAAAAPPPVADEPDDDVVIDDEADKADDVVMASDDSQFMTLAERVDKSRPERVVPKADPGVMMSLAGLGYRAVVAAHGDAKLPIEVAAARCALIGLDNMQHQLAAVTACRDFGAHRATDWGTMILRKRDSDDDWDICDASRAAAVAARVATKAVLEAAALRMDEQRLELAAASTRINMLTADVASRSAECDKLRAEIRAMTAAKRKQANEERSAKRMTMPLPAADEPVVSV